MATDAVTRPGPLRQLKEEQDTRGAVVRYGRKFALDTFCEYCYTFGHVSEDRVANVVCGSSSSYSREQCRLLTTNPRSHTDSLRLCSTADQ
ncbi:hypothetical protein CP532_6495 [Ophiocordyceps camponoti-leonardi (nom. inval.)]|nr:hypothetical protein CP532_6495 [Ophiocordyceps camponoti-leonardi (nom. inval.)]